MKRSEATGEPTEQNLVTQSRHHRARRFADLSDAPSRMFYCTAMLGFFSTFCSPAGSGSEETREEQGAIQRDLPQE